MADLHVIEQFIASSTGLPIERVSRLCRCLDEFSPNFSGVVGLLAKEADDAGVSIDAAWDAYQSILMAEAAMGSEGAHPLERLINTYIDQVVSLTGEDTETVKKVYSLKRWAEECLENLNQWIQKRKEG